MKKRQLFILGAAAAFMVSCNGGGTISTNVTLQSETDTIAYAYGVDVAEKGLMQYLGQLGVLKDTAQFRRDFNADLAFETDSAKVQELKRLLPSKIDSLNKANNKNLNDFIAGMKAGFNVDDSKASYQRGMEVGGQLKQMSDNFSKAVYGEFSDEKINKDAFLGGVATVLNRREVKVSNPSTYLQNKMTELQDRKIRESSQHRIDEGEKFLSENKSKEGVVTMPNGLQYKIITEGDGAKPSATDKVKVHYHGTLLDGTVFDSSVNRGEPAVLGVNEVISGWTQALQMMPVGSKWELYIPYDLAYGSRATGMIDPYSTLIFEVELLGIED